MFDIKTGSLIDAKDLKQGDIPRISVKTTDNGVIGTYQTKDFSNARHFENFISVNFFGQAFYHPYKASVEMKVHVLQLHNQPYTKRSGVFIVTQLNKSFKDKYSYGNQLSSSDLKHKNLTIKLPIKSSHLGTMLENIDFKFMEDFIAELEAQRIAELEAYLITTNLKDYNLTTDEKTGTKRF